ncbi:MAG: hypothetical protein WAL56_15165 [Candidatus Sulfotelmatobacter sp.]
MTLIAHLRWAMLAVLLCTIATYANDKDKNSKPSGVQTVDSGSFGVFVRGQRVVTETFSIHQDNGVSIVKSHLQETANSSGPGQKSDLEMTGNGELVRYEWTDGNSSLTVTPKDEFLLEKITTGSSSKAAEQPFLMPNTSAILDNNFFIHREVLAWRYLATNCHTDSGTLKCQQGPVEFGVLVPQDRTSMRVRMELGGREKVTIRGSERELLRLNLKGENFSWALWVDDKDQFKLIRVLIADDNTEVTRD